MVGRWQSGCLPFQLLEHGATVRVMPALEYNIFPYSESTRRILRIQYSAGVEFRNTTQVTMFDQLEETVPRHT